MAALVDVAASLTDVDLAVLLHGFLPTVDAFLFHENLQFGIVAYSSPRSLMPRRVFPWMFAMIDS